MYIQTDSKDFVPKDFKILNFYGIETCFAWNEDKLIYFPYVYKDFTEKLKVLKAPAKIKDIRGFEDRIFILFYPSGIYKFNQKEQFVLLSKTGIELGTKYAEIFTSSNDVLILEDKKEKHIKKYFPMTSSSQVHVLSLGYDTCDKQFYRKLVPDTNGENLCIISRDKQLFKMCDQVVQIIYQSDHLIKRIHPVEKNGLVIGTILQTDKNIAIFMYVDGNKLKYDKILFETDITNVIAIVDADKENKLIVINSDNEKTYIREISFGDLAQEVTIQDFHYQCFRLYKTKFVIFLNDSSVLTETEIKNLSKPSIQNSNNFIKLEANMLQDLDKPLEKICDKTFEIKELKEVLEEKENVLKRINLFINRKRIRYNPQESVNRFMNHTVLISNYEKVLPQNCTIVKLLKTRGKTIFSMKTIENHDTIFEMPISIQNLSSDLSITNDLITYKNDDDIWCIVKNYIQDPLPVKKQQLGLPDSKIELVKHKLLVLQECMKDNRVTMNFLSKLKREIRLDLEAP